MKHRIYPFMAVLAAALLGLAPNWAAAEDGRYRVTITNVSPGQSLTPVLVFSHDSKAMPFFTPGQPAESALEQLAEGGNTMPLLDKMMAMGEVTDYASVTGLTGPGGSATVTLMADEHGRIGLGAMLLPTNDGFIAAHGIPLPKGKRMVTQTLGAMDAGTELNDELCVHIPGPTCGGEGVSDAGGEGFVHVHGGIHGSGDLTPSASDWRNPVVKITVERVDD